MENSRRIFLKKIYEEYLEFKDKLLQKSKDDIYGDSYKIEVFVNLYEILVEKSDYLSSEILRNLLNQSVILETLYNSWMKKEDSSYDELKQHVEEELKNK